MNGSEDVALIIIGSEDVALIIIMPIMIAFWAWVVWAILEWRKMRHKSQLQNKIVEKFSTVQEFNDFLQSKEGNRFLDFLKFNGFTPRGKILSSLSKGVILFFLGVALVIIGQIFTGEMKYFALGVGFLISTFISYKLSKKWGIIDEER